MRRFSSSRISDLLTTGKGEGGYGARFHTYVEEVAMAITAKKQLKEETNARGVVWGRFVEQRVFNILPKEYELMTEQRLVHPTIKYWSGIPDTRIKEDGKIIIGDIKCPSSLKGYINLALAIKQDKLKEYRPSGFSSGAYYWQLVSNCILAEADHAELIIYCPYQTELSEIRNMADNYDGDQNKIAFINWATDAELPHLNPKGDLKNMYSIRFEIPEEDKETLTYHVKQACEYLDKQLAIMGSLF